MQNSGIVPPTGYHIQGSLVETEPESRAEPFITDITGDTAPGPALQQISWGPNGPNAAIDFDTQRNLVLDKIARGKQFSGVTRGLGNIQSNNA